MRKSFNGLSGIVTEHFDIDLFSGHRESSQEAEQFVTHYLRMLLEGKVGYVIGIFRRRLSELNQSKQETFSKVLNYFDNNRHYMHYDDHLAKGYPICSGVAEGTCRHLVRDRMEGTGMRWELDRAQAMLHTRSHPSKGIVITYIDCLVTILGRRLAHGFQKLASPLVVFVAEADHATAKLAEADDAVITRLKIVEKHESPRLGSQFESSPA